MGFLIAFFVVSAILSVVGPVLLGIFYAVTWVALKILVVVGDLLSEVFRIVSPYLFRFLDWLCDQIEILLKKGARAAYNQCVRLWNSYAQRRHQNSFPNPDDAYRRFR